MEVEFKRELVQLTLLIGHLELTVQLTRIFAWQVVFALIAPGQVVANLAAGAIAEAGAQQAGDMMQVQMLLSTLRIAPFQKLRLSHNVK